MPPLVNTQSCLAPSVTSSTYLTSVNLSDFATFTSCTPDARKDDFRCIHSLQLTSLSDLFTIHLGNPHNNAFHLYCLDGSLEYIYVWLTQMCTSHPKLIVNFISIITSASIQYPLVTGLIMLESLQLMIQPSIESASH